MCVCFVVLSQPCSEGSYSDQGAGVCLECPPGHSCRNGSMSISPTPCEAGFFSYGGQPHCSACPEGLCVCIHHEF